MRRELVSNALIAKLFAEGAESGKSGSMAIIVDKLYSYAACIAIREDDKFIFTNRTNFLGGMTCSKTTSNHISLAYEACKRAKPIILVNGWADRSKPEWFPPSSYKTTWGIMKGFACGMCGGWVGTWDIPTRSRQIQLEIKDNKLYSADGLIAIREYIKIPRPDPVICGLCPVRFECMTEKILLNNTVKCPSYLFYITKGTKYEQSAKKYLRPYKDLT